MLMEFRVKTKSIKAINILKIFHILIIIHVCVTILTILMTVMSSSISVAVRHSSDHKISNDKLGTFLF